MSEEQAVVRPQGGPAENGGEASCVSVVVPLYNEVESLGPLVERLAVELPALNRPFEAILVNDGSDDGTAGTLAELAQRHDWLTGVYLARNYGQSTAMQAGFDAATGEIIVTLDGDLQNDPADIARILDVLESEGLDFVSGWRKDRHDGTVRVALSKIANGLISKLTGIAIHDFGCTLKAYRRDMLSQIKIYGEMHRFIPALLGEIGAVGGEMVVQHHPRKLGTSKYKLDRIFRVVLDIMLLIFLRTYSQRPIHIFGTIGIAMFGLGGAIFSYLGFLKIFLGEEIGQRPLLMLGAVMFIAGVTMIGQGVLGEMLARILHGSEIRPQYRLQVQRQRRGGNDG